MAQPAPAPDPARLTASSLALVALGGAVGTALRAAIALAVPPTREGLPLAIFAVNVVGAFLLGALVSALGRESLRASQPRRRALRALLGAGVLGGFTTYSALAVDTALLAEHAPALAAGYLLVSVVAGLAAAACGLWLGAGRLGADRPRGSAT